MDNENIKAFSKGFNKWDSVKEFKDPRSYKTAINHANEKFSDTKAPQGTAKNVGSAARGIAGGAAVAGIAGAIDGMNTSTKEYADRMGIDEPESEILKTAVRTAGVLSDVGNAALGGIPKRLREREKEDQARKEIEKDLAEDEITRFRKGWNLNEEMREEKIK